MATLAELPVASHQQQGAGGDEMARWRTALKELARATDHAEERYSSLRDQLVRVLVCLWSARVCVCGKEGCVCRGRSW